MKLVQIAGNDGVGEDGLRLFQHGLSVITPADVMENQILHACFSRQASRRPSGDVPVVLGKVLLFFKIGRFNHQQIGASDELVERSGAANIAHKAEFGARLRLTQYLFGLNRAPVRKRYRMPGDKFTAFRTGGYAQGFGPGVVERRAGLLLKRESKTARAPMRHRECGQREPFAFKERARLDMIEIDSGLGMLPTPKTTSIRRWTRVRAGAPP